MLVLLHLYANSMIKNPTRKLISSLNNFVNRITKIEAKSIRTFFPLSFVLILTFLTQRIEPLGLISRADTSFELRTANHKIDVNLIEIVYDILLGRSGIGNSSKCLFNLQNLPYYYLYVLFNEYISRGAKIDIFREAVRRLEKEIMKSPYIISSTYIELLQNMIYKYLCSSENREELFEEVTKILENIKEILGSQKVIPVALNYKEVTISEVKVTLDTIKNLLEIGNKYGIRIIFVDMSAALKKLLETRDGKNAFKELLKIKEQLNIFDQQILENVPLFTPISKAELELLDTRELLEISIDKDIELSIRQVILLYLLNNEPEKIRKGIAPVLEDLSEIIRTEDFVWRLIEFSNLSEVYFTGESRIIPLVDNIFWIIKDLIHEKFIYESLISLIDELPKSLSLGIKYLIARHTKYLDVNDIVECVKSEFLLCLHNDHAKKCDLLDITVYTKILLDYNEFKFIIDHILELIRSDSNFQTQKRLESIIEPLLRSIKAGATRNEVIKKIFMKYAHKPFVFRLILKYVDHKDKSAIDIIRNLIKLIIEQLLSLGEPGSERTAGRGCALIKASDMWRLNLLDLENIAYLFAHVICCEEILSVIEDDILFLFCVLASHYDFDAITLLRQIIEQIKHIQLLSPGSCASSRIREILSYFINLAEKFVYGPSRADLMLYFQYKKPVKAFWEMLFRKHILLRTLHCIVNDSTQGRLKLLECMLTLDVPLSEHIEINDQLIRDTLDVFLTLYLALS